MKQQSSDFQERPKTEEASTAGQVKDTASAGPAKATAAEQSQKGTELKGEKDLKADELLAERTLKVKQLEGENAKLQAKVKDLLEAVRYRDRKISKLGPGVAGGTGKVVGSNTTDHSHLGVEEVVVVPAQATIAPKTVKKPVAPKH